MSLTHLPIKIGSFTLYERVATPEEILAKAKRDSKIQQLQARAGSNRIRKETERKKLDVRNLIKVKGSSDPGIKEGIVSITQSRKQEQVYKRQESQAGRRLLFLENTKATLDAAQSASITGDAIISLSQSDAIKDMAVKLQKTNIAQTKLSLATSQVNELLSNLNESLLEDEEEFKEHLNEEANEEEEDSEYATILQQFLDEDAHDKMDLIPSVVTFAAIPSALPTPPTPIIDLDNLEKRFQELNK